MIPQIYHSFDNVPEIQKNFLLRVSQLFILQNMHWAAYAIEQRSMSLNL